MSWEETLNRYSKLVEGYGESKARKICLACNGPAPTTVREEHDVRTQSGLGVAGAHRATARVRRLAVAVGIE